MPHRLIVDVEMSMQLGYQVQPHGQLVSAIMTLYVGLVACKGERERDGESESEALSIIQ